MVWMHFSKSSWANNQETTKASFSIQKGRDWRILGASLCLRVRRWTSEVAGRAQSLVQSYSSGRAVDRFAHAPRMPSDVEGYSVAARMTCRIDLMRVVNE
jgi:hypothetical protein